MANNNPICLDQDAVVTDYLIPAQFKNDQLFLTITVELLEDKWKYSAAHSVFLNTKNLYPQKFPEPVKLSLGIAAELIDNKILLVSSEVSRFRNGSTSPLPPKVRYHLIIATANTVIDDFTKDSDNENPSVFNSILHFKS